MTNEIQAKIDKLHAIFAAKGYEVHYVGYDHIDRGCMFVRAEGFYNARIEVKEAIRIGATVQYLVNYAEHLLNKAGREDENK